MFLDAGNIHVSAGLTGQNVAIFCYPNWCVYFHDITLALEMLVTTIDALDVGLNRINTARWEGMGDVGSARYEPALVPPCPTIRVLSYSDCERTTHSISK